MLWRKLVIKKWGREDIFGGNMRSSIIDLLYFEKQQDSQEKGVEKQLQRDHAQRKKKGFGLEGQKHQGEKENENIPGHRQGAEGNVGCESGDAQGATKAPRISASKNMQLLSEQSDHIFDGGMLLKLQFFPSRRRLRVEKKVEKQDLGNAGAERNKGTSQIRIRMSHTEV